ncbi:MAG: sensor histidine kinase, partial [Candidatus Obscuribacterales bacterium]|nr:sensor histidine kinase [Candidatus Obscuribacterales bacterium]
LLANAVKFSESGQTVTMTATIHDGTLTIQIQDEGRGIPAEQQSMIFERFKQARSSDAVVGTGLGLAICKMLIDAHGGKIGVESEVGKGSTFFVELPCRYAVSEENSQSPDSPV